MALDVISGVRSATEACREYNLRHSMVSEWKAILMANAANAFDNPAARSREQERIAERERPGELIESRQPDGVGELKQMHRRYLQAASPGKGEKATAAYRLRLLFLDRWELWGRLTCYRSWEGPQGETIDGTNNGSERAIGWWIKERYRPMRGYKRRKSAVNVSRLLAWCGNHLDRGGVDLALLVA